MTAIPLGRRLPGASSNQPGRQDLDIDPEVLALAHQSLAPSLFGLAPGGVCRAAGVAAGAVRSYRTVSPLPRQSRNAPRRSVLCGTIPRLAPAGCYPAPLVHGARTFLPGTLSGLAGAAVRPTDREGMGSPAAAVKSRGRYEATTSRSKLMTRAAMVRGRPRWASRSCKVLRVERSVTPSTRSGRKWRWNAVTTSCMAES